MGVLEKYQLSLHEKASLCSGGSSWSTREIKEKGIPGIVMTDGTYGVRYCKPGEECINGVEAMSVVELNLNSDSTQLEKYYRATCFPSPSGFACSWDRTLIEEMARYIGEECGALGVDVLLAPAINIRRDPRGGRGFEYFSEDPVLTAELAKHFIKGIQAAGVGACLKHFACNNSEYQRTKMDSIVDARALREIYLYAFQEIVKTVPPMAIMSSYNKLNGEQVSESKTLLTKILRDEWHYEGMVVSDWGGIKDRVAAIRAGGDLEMPKNIIFNQILEDAVTSGELKPEELDACVERVLAFVERAAQNRKRQQKVADGCLGYKLAVKVAAESCVLLKNEHDVLPLNASKIRRLAVIGDMAITPRYQGGGCAVINPTTISIPYDEIVRTCGPSVNVRFSQGYTASDQTTPELLDQVRREAALADYVIAFAGVKVRDDTEGFNREHLRIEPAHIQMIRAAAEVNQRVIVVLNNGDAVTMEEFEPLVPAILECFFNGQGGGVAVAKILFGEANPCGKLTATFPKREEDIPAFLSFPGEFGRHYYQESIFVGYRYYDKRNIQPKYEFGYGLSYTKFLYSDFQANVSPDGAYITAHVTIKNTGMRAGKEIVQFYLEPLETNYLAPCRMLKGFDKVELAPGEAKIVRITLSCRELFQYFDPDLDRFVVGSGVYALACGASSRQIYGKQAFQVSSPSEFKPFQIDSLHNEIFADEASKEIYVEYLKKIHVIDENTDIHAAIASLQNMFWGLYRALIAISIAKPEVRVDKQELEAVVQEMNRRRMEAIQREGRFTVKKKG